MQKLSSRAYDPHAEYEIKSFDVEYRDGLLARVYQPQGEGPFPAMIDVHGGAWNFGSRLNNEVMDVSLAASGLLVVAVDFRMPPENPFPAQTADVNYAIRWLKRHARDYNGDATHLGGLGSSSGGQSIMLAAMRPRDPLYRAMRFPEAPRTDASLSWVLACWGVLDPYARYMYAKEASQRLVDATENYFVTEENMKLGNPQYILERGDETALPHVLIIQGTNDDNVPLSIPTRFEESYRAAGGSIRVEWFEGEPHAFASKPGPAGDRALKLMKEFIAAELEAASANG